MIIKIKSSQALRTSLIWLLSLLSLLGSSASLAGPPASAKPFVCESPVYQVARSDSQLIRISISGSEATFTDIGSSAGSKINAGWGYNQLDSLGYGVGQSTQTLYAIDADGVIYDLGTVAGMGSRKGGFAGDILPNGTMLFRNSASQIMTLDLSVEPYTISSTINLTGAASSANYADLAYNPIDGMIYAIDHRANRAFYFDPAVGATTYFGTSNLTGAYGALWFDEDGYMYAYDNGTNRLFLIDAGVLGSGTGTATYLATSPVDEGGTNDGLSCRGPALLPLLDHGDANESYGESPHRVASIATVYLGANKPDVDSTPKNAANGSTDGLGDDNDGNDDEDGISFPNMVQGETATLTATLVGNNGYLQAWIDWDNDGTFIPSEQVVTNLQDTDNDGVINFDVAIPSSATTSQTTARFRWSTDVNLTLTDEASDGEVEDYLITILPPIFLTLTKELTNNDGGTGLVSDWTLRAIGSEQTHSGKTNDAAITNALVSAGTYTLSELGPSDYIRTNLSCDGGDLNGNELTIVATDGSVSCTFSNDDQATISECSPTNYVSITPSDLGLSATASQNNINANYDISSLLGLSAGAVQLTLSNAAIRNNTFTTSQSSASNWSFTSPAYPLYLRVEHDASLDGDNLIDGFKALDGVLYSPDNTAPTGYFYSAVQQATQLEYFVEAGPDATAQTQIFSWSSLQAASQLQIETTHTDALDNDYLIQAALCSEEDWGDAPTVGTNYGHARHIINTGVYLGSTPPDAESSTQPSIDADADDSGSIDDEDGIADLPILTDTDTDYSLSVSCTGINATVAAWIDLNNDGTFEAIERNTNHPVSCGSGEAILEWSGLIGLIPSSTYLRVRTASDPDEVANPTGSALDGEVEDYNFTIANQVMTEPTTGACVSEGGSIIGDNIITEFDGGTFGEENGFTGQSPDTDPYLNKVLGGVYAQYNSRSTAVPSASPTSGQFSYVSNIAIARNASQHEPVVDPVYGMTGRFLVSDPDNTNTQVLVTLTGLTPNKQYEYSFWAANPERNGAANEIAVSVDGTVLFTTGALVADSSALPWQRYSFTFTNGANTSANVILSTMQSNKVGYDFYIDNMEAKVCDFLNDFGDAPASYGIAHHISPLNPTLLLGSTIDEEEVSQHSANSDLDDLTGTDDEDSIASLSPLLNTDRIYRVTTNVTNLSGSAATLIAWIDFDQSGTFDQDEAAVRQIASGTNGADLTLQWSNIPQDIQIGDTHLRLRITNTDLAIGEATGKKRDGEVEDYALTITDSLSVSGRVYNDINTNGVSDNGESGIENVTIVLLDTTNQSCRSVKTNGSGAYYFSDVAAGSYLVYEAANESIPTPANCGISFAQDPANYASTTDNVLSQFNITDTPITNQDFGDVSTAIFEPNHQGQILPGNVTFYAHRFRSTYAGQVTFTQTTNNTSWASLLYQDTDCDGSLNDTEAADAITSNIAVSANTPICIINKVYAPTNTPVGDLFTQIISAAIDTGNTVAGSQTLTVQDDTTVQQVQEAGNSEGASNLSLLKTVQNLSLGSTETESVNNASPGQTLRYLIYYRNTGTGPIDDLQINDTIPDFTVLVTDSESCTTTPSTLTCQPFINNSDIGWLFTGSLLGGQEGAVSFDVTILE